MSAEDPRFNLILDMLRQQSENLTSTNEKLDGINLRLETYIAKQNEICQQAAGMRCGLSDEIYGKDGKPGIKQLVDQHQTQLATLQETVSIVKKIGIAAFVALLGVLIKATWGFFVAAFWHLFGK